MFAIAWQYLTGQATATDPTNRLQAEWPPHPDRVFQALVAAWGERSCNESEKCALEWIESLGPPMIAAPDEDKVTHSILRTFVPVNDVAAFPAKRKERSFATTYTGDAICTMIWPEVTMPTEHQKALKALTAAATHIGHSRSLVRMWLEDGPPAAVWREALDRERHDLLLRIPHIGRLNRLIHAYADSGELWQRPPLAPWQRYVKISPDADQIPHSHFDPRLIVLRRVGGDGIPGLLQAPAFCHALRSAVLSKANERAKPLISGHNSDNSPLKQAHVSWLPLAHIGHQHADGHLLGMAMVLPLDLSPDDEHAVLDALADAINRETGELKLVAGKAGSMFLAEDDRQGQPSALRPRTWTKPSGRWGTVTPIALDRLPPRRHVNDDIWVAEQIAACCTRAGLPSPQEVQVLPVSPYSGAPTCRQFPPLLRKPDRARRWHVHARICFEQKVSGPLLLGAGRYCGYGLCKPLWETI